MPQWVIDNVPFLATLAALVALLWRTWPFLRRFFRFLDAIMGHPGKPGMPARPSILERLETSEQKQAETISKVGHLEGLAERVEDQLKPNGGSSTRDQVDAIRRHVTALDNKLTGHINRYEGDNPPEEQ